MSKSFCPCCGTEQTISFDIVCAVDRLKGAGFRVKTVVMNDGHLQQLKSQYTPPYKPSKMLQRFYGMDLRIDNTATTFRIEVEA